ncbi:hypothetical protein I12421_09290 [Campylobacter lari]|uniref:phosphotransferase n=1 Tax=Campylobacter lari TaxID=201 RepID=UPI002581C8F8|nr:phosphotransferase [Campylobacter lari]GMM10552.1 hypothetical protein I12421_09290 [Campylobacter lari]HDV6339769.1 phosphotransferase [Campylobacter lari]
MKHIYIEGNSGCNLKIISDNVIFKSTLDREYLPRLKKQCEKQKKFFFLFKENFINKNKKFVIPEIFEENWSCVSGLEYCGFYMQYFQANDFIKFLAYSDIKNVLEVIYCLFDFIDNNISKSEITSIDSDILQQKYLEVNKNIFKRHGNMDSLFDIFKLIERDLQDLPSTINIPIGYCHGDLTFSNILFAQNKIILIDFLDSFIESPLQDIVKLRQDTKHLWSSMFFKGDYDKIKNAIIMDFFDDLINKYFRKYDFYMLYYRIFQRLNLLRIIPYIKQDNILTYIIKEIHKV